MRRILCLIFCLIVLASCSLENRVVSIRVPGHPWEEISKSSMWYQIEVVSCSSVQWYYLGPGERNLSVPVPRGQTVLILAYPMGKYAPFGGHADPSVSENTVLLSRDEGVLCSALLTESAEFLAELDYGYLLEKTRAAVPAMRFLDTGRLVSDYVSRSLSEASLRRVEAVLVKDAELPSGLYYSEFAEDGYFECYDNCATFFLPCGETSFYNFELNIVVRFFVSSGGQYSFSVSEGLL